MINSAVIQLLDVRELEPPEPLTSILTTLERMAVTQALKVLHRREPFPLYPILDDMGYDHRCWMLAEDDYRLYIWRSDQQPLETLCVDDIRSEQLL